MIPILDWSRWDSDRAGLVADLGAACRGPGFFLLVNAPVGGALRAQVLAQAEAFFALPQSRKAQVGQDRSPHFRGWGAAGRESLDDRSAQVDRKETFNIGLDLAPDDARVLAGAPFRGVNLWPDLPGFRTAVLSYFDQTQRLGRVLMQAVALDLGLPQAYFDAALADGMSVLRLLHYPPATGATDEIGAGAHTDYGALTLLMTDGEPGLQVRPRGADWQDVPDVPGAFIVNIGDALMRWTNDIYMSTPHRVLAPARTRRSVALFLEANPDAMIAPLPGTGAPRYAPIRAAEYLQGRLDATYAPKALT